MKTKDRLKRSPIGIALTVLVIFLCTISGPPIVGGLVIGIPLYVDMIVDRNKIIDTVEVPINHPNYNIYFELYSTGGFQADPFLKVRINDKGSGDKLIHENFGFFLL